MSPGMIWPAKDCPRVLGLDQACFKVFNKLSETIQLYAQLEECYQSLCECKPWKVIGPGENASLLVNSAYPLRFYYMTNSSGIRCSESFRFSEHGVYSWNTSEESLCTHVEPESSLDIGYWLPVAVAVLVLVLSSAVYTASKIIYRSNWMSSFRSRYVLFSNLATQNDFNIPPDNPRQGNNAAVPTTRRQSSRIASLDTFRGICISMMIFVNYGGGQYTIFKHAAWNGLTFADLVFPWFLWIMGISLVLSLRSHFRDDRSRITVWLLVLRRSLILITLGLILNSIHQNDFAHIRIPGVLQRIGLAYFIIASVETCFINPGGPFQSRFCEDIINGWIQTLFASLLALTWTVTTFVMDVPGCGRGYLGPGGMERDGKFENCTGGAAGYIDRMVFTPQHIYQNPTCKRVYGCTQPYDPEGLLGTLTAALLVHMGAHAGRISLCYSFTWSRVARWLVWGSLSCLCAWLLYQYPYYNGSIPINKNLFSLSYVLLTGGTAFIFLAILYTVIDYREIWDGAPFSYAGMNAILLYIGHELARDILPWGWKPIWNTHAELLAMNLWGTCLWLVIAYILYRKNIKVTF